MTVAEYYIVLPDIPRILTALAQWISCLCCILIMKRRFHGAVLAGISAGFLLLQSVFLVVTDSYEGIAWNFCMMVSVFLMFAFLRTVLAIPMGNLICRVCTAFVLAEFSASLEWQIWCYLDDTFELSSYWNLPLVAIVFGLIFLMTFRIGREVLVQEESYEVSRQEIVVTAGFTLFIFVASNLGFLPLNLPFAGRDSIEIFHMRTLIDLGGLAVLYACQSQWKSSYIQQELTSIQTILENQYEQYKQAQRAVDLINFRYHDLKNHIIALRADTDAPQRQAYLDRLESEIRDYETLNKTGNQVLDTLLTSKNLRCSQHKIDMTCVVDGELFSFMDVMDICAIFGNAIDNAIECELKIPDYEKRMIHVDAFSERQFLIIRFENYFEGKIDLNKGLPETTKTQKASHGYGLKSLRYTVHKYRGEVQIEAEDHWFSLRILIPTGQSDQADKEKTER